MSGGHQRRRAFLTTFVALPLLNLQREVERADGEVDSLGVHSSHLADKRGSQITFQRTLLSFSLSPPGNIHDYYGTEEEENVWQEREAERKTRNGMNVVNRKSLQRARARE